MLSHNVESLLVQRYYQPNETWDTLIHRVVNHVCEGESVEFKNSVYKQLYDRVWLPNSPCLVNAGLSNGGLMACFVVGPDEDTLEHHVETLGDIAAVGKRGGGAGFSGASVRPKGAEVSGSAHDTGQGIAYGPNWWAVQVSNYLAGITQGGFRRMALMYSLPADHPDIKEFIKLKHNGNERFGYNFNQSVFATDEWMKAATNGQATSESETLTSIANHAHANGEPGLLFDTKINTDTPYATCGCEIRTTNPCGEEPLPSFGSCDLGSINLNHEIFYTNSNNFNFTALASVVSAMVRFLDNVGSANIFPNDKFKMWYEKHRPIGIGVMGLADALLRLGRAYGEPGSLNFIGDVMSVIQGESYRASEKLGQERGIPEHCRAVNRRNITTVSVAPTGSISLLAECSPSIEPIYSPKFKRTDERGETYIFEHPRSNQLHFRSTLNEDKNKIPSWRQHVDIQAAAQRYVDSGVSKTINMLNGVSKKDVYNAFVYAWQKRCKGITVYRDGSRDVQVLEDIKEEDSLLAECPTGACIT